MSDTEFRRIKSEAYEGGMRAYNDIFFDCKYHNRKSYAAYPCSHPCTLAQHAGHNR